MLSHDIDNIVKAAVNRNMRDVQWLSVNHSVYCIREELPELSGIHICRAQNLFIEIFAIAGVVGVVCQHAAVWSDGQTRVCGLGRVGFAGGVTLNSAVEGTWAGAV